MGSHDESEMLRAAMRAHFSRLSPRVGRTEALDATTPEAAWKSLADHGWLNVFASDGTDDSLGKLTNVVTMAQESGRALLEGPLLQTAVLGVLALRGVPSIAEEYLASVLAGERQMSLISAVTGIAPTASEPMKVAGGPDGWFVDGTAEIVPASGATDLYVLVALTADNERLIAMVDRAQPGFAIRQLTSVDPTRPLATVRCQHVPVAADRFVLGPAADRLSAQFRLVGALYLGSESLGIAQAMLDIATSYATNRTQFGKPIGAFQAVAHPLAALYVDIETMSALVNETAAALDVMKSDAETLVSMVKSRTCRLAIRAARCAIQVHGGYGYSWEQGLHLYLRRALLNERLFGDSDWHAARVFQRTMESIAPSQPGGFDDDL